MRTSALHDRHLERVADAASWVDAGGMRLPRAYPNEGDPARLALADASHLFRAGVKGPQAAELLLTLNLPVPAKPNHWLPLPQGGIVARVGLSEFFLEDRGDTVARLAGACQGLPAGVYPVLRADTALVLCGHQANEVLLQTCNVDFRAIEAGAIALTSMAGVAVLVIAQHASKIPIYRIWCDPSYGPYPPRNC